MPSMVLGTLYAVSSHAILRITLQSWCYCSPHLTVKKTGSETLCRCLGDTQLVRKGTGPLFAPVPSSTRSFRRCGFHGNPVTLLPPNLALRDPVLPRLCLPQWKTLLRLSSAEFSCLGAARLQRSPSSFINPLVSSQTLPREEACCTWRAAQMLPKVSTP